MICPNCGRENRGSFCTNCGTKLTPPADAPARNPAPQEPVPGATPGAAVPVAPAAPETPPAAPAYPTSAPPAGYGGAPAANYGRPAVNYGAPAYQTPPQSYGAPAYGAPVPPYMPPVYPPRNRFGGQGQRPVSREGRRVARRLGSSPAYLIASVAFTLYMLLFTVFAVRVIGALTGAERYWRGGYISGLFSERITEREAVMWVVYCGISVLFSVLITAGLWITFGSAVKRGSDRMSGAGLTMIKVVTIIRLVLFCIFFALVLFGALIGGLIQGAVNDAFEFAELREVGILYFLLMTSILVGFMVMGILYYAGILRTLNAVRSSLQTGIPNPGASGYVAVMNFLMTTGLLYLTLRVFRTDGALFGLALLCLCVSLCTFGVCIFQYRGAMTEAAAAEPETM